MVLMGPFQLGIFYYSMTPSPNRSEPFGWEGGRWAASQGNMPTVSIQGAALELLDTSYW